MNYEKYFLISDRISSKTGKTAKVVDPQYFNEFLAELQNDPDLPLWFKATVACGICLGGRVSEILKLKKGQIQEDGTVNELVVLKKRREGITREGKLHPTALSIIQAYLRENPKRPQEYLFKFSRQTAHRWVKTVFGTDFHALCRHSFISLLVDRNLDGMKIARMLKLSNVNVAYGYCHIKPSRVMDSIYEKAA